LTIIDLEHAIGDRSEEDNSVAVSSTKNETNSDRNTSSTDIFRVAKLLADLTQWRRRAIELTLEPFPPQECQPPYVSEGSLLIVGGGGLPQD
jgi:hypothetical protein